MTKSVTYYIIEEKEQSTGLSRVHAVYDDESLAKEVFDHLVDNVSSEFGFSYKMSEVKSSE